MSVAEQARTYETSASSQRIGETALWGAGVFKAELGVNDPLTHLEQFLEHGEAGMASIDEDLITDCAERLTKPRFINSVGFRRSGSDFISSFNEFSMRSMTAITEDKFGKNVVDLEQYRRAKIESREVERLGRWFDSAEPDDAFIVESLPLNTKERYALARIYQKVNDRDLVMHVVTLHNGDLNIFNGLRRELGVGGKTSNSTLELLDNMYDHQAERGSSFNDFIQKYVATYDYLLAKHHPGQAFSYGLNMTESNSGQDDMQMIRGQKSLRSIYLDTLRALGKSEGYITPQLLNINQKLSLNLPIQESQMIPTQLARDMLDKSLQYIMATLNEASEDKLRQLAISDSGHAYSVAGGYGSAAAAAGIRYEGACPSSQSGAASAEAAALSNAYRSEKDPTKCVKCPECRKTVDLPKELFKKGIYHCVECKATYHKGKKIHLESDQETPDVLDRLSSHWNSIKEQTQAEQARARRLQAERELAA